MLADYYGIRGRILFTKTHARAFLATVYLGLVATMLVRVVRRQPKRARMIGALMLWGLGLSAEEPIRRRYGIRVGDL